MKPSHLLSAVLIRGDFKRGLSYVVMRYSFPDAETINTVRPRSCRPASDCVFTCRLQVQRMMRATKLQVGVIIPMTANPTNRQNHFNNNTSIGLNCLTVQPAHDSKTVHSVYRVSIPALHLPRCRGPHDVQPIGGVVYTGSPIFHEGIGRPEFC